MLTAPISKSESTDITTYPLSIGQQTLWSLCQDPSAAAMYNGAFVMRVLSSINVAALRQTFQALADRHDALRTTIEMDSAGDLRQTVHAQRTVNFVWVDAADWDEARLFAEAFAAHNELFDLEADSLIRVRLFTQEAQRHLLLVTVPHIVSDGWSMVRLMMREIKTLYPAYCAGLTPHLPPLPSTYADYVAWQSAMLTQRGSKLGVWWKKELGSVQPLALPTDYPRPPVQTFHGSAHYFRISAELTAPLKHLSQEAGSTLYMTLLAAFQLLLYRYTGQNEIIVGTPAAGRVQSAFMDIVGYFSNFVPMRSELTPNLTFTELLERIKRASFKAQMHQAYPFSEMVRHADFERDPSYPPLMQVGFNFMNALSSEGLQEFVVVAPDADYSDCRIDWGGLLIEPYHMPQQQAIVDLTLELEDGIDGTLAGVLKYNTDLFNAATIERMVGHLTVLLEGVVRQPNSPVSRLPLLTEREYAQIVHDWNDTALAYGEPRTIHALFEAQVARTPDAVALVYEDAQLTYSELNERANQLAHHLIELGVQPDMLVAVLMERSVEMVVSLLAVLKAGGAYVPIDPTYPDERTQYMLMDSQAQIVLTQAHLPFNGGAAQRIDVDVVALTTARDNLQTAVTPQNLAYCIYTSGSTGRPKGIAITHHNIFNFLMTMQREPGIEPADSLLAVTTISFDIAVLELYLPLMTGASVVVASQENAADPDALSQLISKHNITVMQATPATWLMLTTHPAWLSLPPLKVLCGGEALPLALARQLVAQSQDVWNMYGPTEATVWAAAKRLETTVQRVTIAPPIANTTFYILDQLEQVVPLSVAGELYIGGVQLARGYWNRPKLTAERFIEHPEFGRLYKTGDLCRWLPDGAGNPVIEYLGRTDFQVKIRGFRIELGEIENALLAQEGVREAVVVARGEGGDKRLVAYLVGEAKAEALRQQLGKQLPDYMIPSAFVTLTEMPLTPNGKLDRRALPAPEFSSEVGYVAPVGDLETKIAAIWGEILRVERVGRHDNFFHMGGHSLLATRVISRVRTALKMELPLKTLFEASELAAFARVAGEMKGEVTQQIIPIPRTGKPLPLSFSQQRLWFLDQLQPNSGLYNIPSVIRLNGRLDVDALEKSFTYLIARHESLRTTFVTVEGEPVQVIHPPTPFALVVHEIVPEQEAQSREREEAARPFDLQAGPLIRAQLLRQAADDHWLLLTLHHIVSDEWSIGVLVEELSHAYRAYLAGQEPTLPDHAIQYADFAAWQREYLQGERLDKQLTFWRNHLRGAPALLELPTDYPRPATQSYAGNHYPFELSAELTAKLHQLAQAHNATLFMVLLAAFNVLLARYSRQTDIVVGTPIANRNRSEIEGLIGFFVNTLVLRTDLEDNPTFSELLQQVRTNTLAAYDHQDVPFEQLVDELDVSRSLSHSPLFQAMLVWQNEEMATFEMPALTAQMQYADFPFAAFDLTLYILEEAGELRGTVEYATDLFGAETISRMVQHLTVLLAAVVSQPDQPVQQLPLLTEQERQQIGQAWNGTAVDYGEPETLHALFEQQVAKTPEAVALLFEDEQLTYAELNAKANQLAHHLIQLGVQPDMLVAVLMEQSVEMVVALLAVLKAGGAYVPIDPTYPDERIQYMLADSCTQIVLTQTHLPLDGEAAQRIDVDALTWTTARDNPQTAVTPQNLAYCIYTSGSTGRPKGVLVTHAAISHHVQSVIDLYDIGSADCVLQFASTSFDASIEQLFGPLCGGAKLLLRGSELWTVQQFDQQTRKHGVTICDLPPAYCQQVVAYWLANPRLFTTLSARLMLVGGEKVDPKLVEQWQQLPTHSMQLVNVYGPTEAVITSTWYELTSHNLDSSNNLPIGQPLPNRRVFVLDSERHLTPVGIPGELYIGGGILARGYLNRPELTAEYFIEHPEFGRLYRTGDLCRWLPNGNIEYLGRIDFQVKIRGFRIELGEIENALLAQEEIQEAVVVAREEAHGDMGSDKRLVAYLVGEAEVETVRQQLGKQLPDYMIPSAFVTLSEMPLTPNGKLNRRALPAPSSYGHATNAYVAPRSWLEMRVAEIWRRELQLDRVGIDDNFFEIGGHSLLLIKVQYRVRKIVGDGLQLADMLHYQTIRTFCQHVMSNRNGENEFFAKRSKASAELVALREGIATETPLLCLPGVGGGVTGFLDLVAAAKNGLPIYGLQYRDLVIPEDAALPSQMSDFLAYFINPLTTLQTEEQHIIGHSAGGVLAFLLAIALQQAGKQVPLLGIMDSAPPVRSNGTQTAVTMSYHQWVAKTVRLSKQILNVETGQAMEARLNQLSESELWEAVFALFDKHSFLSGEDGVIYVKQRTRFLQTMEQCLLTYDLEANYAGQLILFRATQPTLPDPDPLITRWQAVCEKPIVVYHLPCTHGEMGRAPYINQVGELLQQHIYNTSLV